MYLLIPMIAVKETEKYCEENFGQCELINVVKHSSSLYTLKCSEICDSDLNIHLTPLRVSLHTNDSIGDYYGGFIHGQRDTTSVTLKLSDGLVSIYVS